MSDNYLLKSMKQLSWVFPLDFETRFSFYVLLLPDFPERIKQSTVTNKQISGKITEMNETLFPVYLS